MQRVHELHPKTEERKMSIYGALFNSAQKKAELAAMKFGKTEEQKQVIDFFMTEGGGCCGCLGKSSKMTMDGYLSLINNKCASLNLRQRALEKIGLDEAQISEIPPILMTSFIYSGDKNFYVRIEDGQVVTSRYSVTWIFFSAEQMYTYKYVFNTTSDDTIETTNDVFYRDITNLRTITKEIEHIDSVAGCGCLGKPKADKVVYSYSAFEVLGAGLDLYFEMRSTPTIEQSIQAAKAMLREKKYSI